MNKPAYYFSAVCLCFLLFTLACHRTGPRTNNREETLVAEGFVVSPGHFENRLTVTANLLPFESVEIKTPVTGTVLAIHFDEGQYVKQGQSLVQIDDRVWKAQIKALRAQLVAANQELKRKEALLKAEGASLEEVETIRSTVQQLEARIEELSVYVSLAGIPAPFSGKVGMRDFSVGAFLSQGQPVTQIAQSGKLKVDFNLPAHYVSQLSVGKEVTIIANGDSATAPVYAVNPVADESARTIRVRASLNNQRNWLPGDFAEVSLILDIHDSAFVIPTQIIVPELGAETVFLCKKGKVVKQTIKTSVRNSQVALVTAGLATGDTLLTTGLMQVREGIPVKIGETTSSTKL